MSPRASHVVAAILLTAHAVLLACAATKHSPSIDEVGHMAAGLSHWRLGRFDLYRVNPPLVRLVATAPVALLRSETDWQGYSLLPGARSEFECGEHFIAANGQRSFWLFTVARWACLPFSLLGGYVCYRWSGALYGAAGGLLALTLWCFCPNILAHAQMITPDVGATGLGTAACYLLWRWLSAPTWPRAFAAGAVLGLAQLTKATFLVFYLVWPLVWSVWRWTAKRPALGRRLDRYPGAPIDERQARDRAFRGAAQLALMAVLSLYIINAGYAFERSFQQLGEFDFVSQALGGPRDMSDPDSRVSNRFLQTPLAGFRVPLPSNYLLGIDHQKGDFEQGYPSYLRGEWRHGGWWYYYLYGLMIKVPLGTWLLFLAGAFVGWALPTKDARRRQDGAESGSEASGKRCPPYADWRDELVLLLPAAAILALVSSQTGFNHHLRYVLPIFPFVFIWIGRLGPHLDLGLRRFTAGFRRRATTIPGRPDETSLLIGESPPTAWQGGFAAGRSGDESPHSKMIAIVVVAGLMWSVGSSLWYYPHSLSYFNELVGGPFGGRWHMLDSNLDWGQDLLYMKRWLDEHPEAKPLGLVYFGYFDPRAAGIEFSLPPKGPAWSGGGMTRSQGALSDEEPGPQPGWYAVSVMVLHGYKYGIPDGEGGKFYTDRPYFTYFQRFEPVASAGYSIYIYRLEAPEVERVRRELGLPPLSDPTPSALTSDGGPPKPPEAS